MFILNRNEEIVAVLSGNADDSGCHFFNALLTVELNKGASLTFEVDTTESDVVKYVKEENMVIVHDGENHRLLVIKEISDIHGDSSMKEVYCEDASSELIDEIIYNEITGNLEMREALTSMLRNTRWQVGEVDNAYIRNLKSDYKLKTVLNGIQTLANDYDAEIDFTVEFAGNKIVSRKVHMKQAFGRTLGKRFEFGKDVTSIKRTVNTADIKTAIVPFGATNEETGEVLTIKDVEWSKPTNPFNKPLGQTYIEDEEATALWGYKGSGQTRRARWIAITFDDCTSANELINYAQLQLNRFNKPKISYEIEVVDLYRMMEDESYSYEKVCLGDLVNIVDHEFVPALALQSRIVKLELDLNDTSNSKVTLGTVVETIVDKDLKTQLEDLNKKVNAVASSIDFSDIEDRLDSLESETGTGKWEQIQEVNNLLFSNAVGYHYMDSSNGIWVFDKPVNEKPTKAVALKGGMIGLAKYDTQKQQWNVGTFIDGTSVNASMINTGTLKADRIEAGALSITHFNKELTNVINSVGTKASKTEVTAAIKTAVDEINLSVSTKYSTKSETSSVVANAKSEAVNSAVNTAKSYADTKKAEAITKAIEDASAYADTKANAVKTALTPLIDGKASKTDVYTKEETYTKGETDSAIKVVKDEITLRVSNTYETKTNVESKITSAVNNVQVGGRNLCTGTKDWSGWGYGSNTTLTDEYYQGLRVYTSNSEWAYRYQDIELEANTEYTVSCWVKTNVAGTKVGCYIWHGDGEGIITLNEVDKWVRYSFTKTNLSKWTQRIRIESGNSINGAKLYLCGFKLEKGNKATDWTPAPEDIDSSISNIQTQVNTTKNQVAEIVTNVDSITQRVQHTENNITTVTDKFNNLQVGGRNLFKGYNDKEFSLNDYNNTGSFTQFRGYFTFNPAEHINKEFTISFYAKSPNGATNLYLYNSNDNPRYFHFWTHLDTNLNNEWKYYTYTFTNIDRGSSYPVDNKIEIYGENKLGVLVKQIKIELGNKATDWTPAPEDINDAINNVNTKVETTKNQVASIETNLNGITQRVSSTEQTITNINNNKEDKNSRYIFARGTGLDYTALSYVTVQGKCITNGQGRGLRINVLNPTTLEHLAVEDYDTYGDWNAVNSFIRRINELNNGNYIIIVTSTDASYPWRCKEVLRSIGGSLLPDTDNTYREAYALIGKSRLGQGNGVEMYIPKTETDRRFAEVSVKVGENGEFIGVNGSNIGSEIIKVNSAIATTNNKVSEIATNLDGINLKVQSTEQTVTNHTTQLNQVDGKIENAKSQAVHDSRIIPDTRGTNETPEWYMKHYGCQTITEFKLGSIIQLAGVGFGAVETKVPWSDPSGGYPVQTFRSSATPTYERRGATLTEWSDWIQVEDTHGSQNKANMAQNNANAYTNGQIAVVNQTISDKVAEIKLTTDSITSKIAKTEQIALITQHSKMIYTDPTFIDGYNNINIYNNNGNGTVSVSRIARANDCPTTSGHMLEITTNGSASPYCGGFFFANQSRPNAIFVARIIAKLPIGSELTWHSNQFGDGGKAEWLTEPYGTGKWTEYILKVTCGASGNFHTTNYFALVSSENPVTWYVAFATIFDVTETSNIESRLSNAEQKITDSAIINTVSNTITNKVNTAINDLQIGNKNIFRYSGNFGNSINHSYWADNGGGITLDTSVKYNGHNTIRTHVGTGIVGAWYELEPNVEYTYSALIRCNGTFQGDGGMPLHWWAGTNNSSEAGKMEVTKVDMSYPVVNEWKVVYITFKLVNGGNSFRPFIYWWGSDFTFNIAYLKLEKGNKATDWTPAPEDIDSSISNIQTQVNTTKNQVASIETNLNGITQRVQHTENISAKIDDINYLTKVAGVELLPQLFKAGNNNGYYINHGSGTFGNYNHVDYGGTLHMQEQLWISTDFIKFDRTKPLYVKFKYHNYNGHLYVGIERYRQDKTVIENAQNNACHYFLSRETNTDNYELYEGYFNEWSSETAYIKLRILTDWYESSGFSQALFAELSFRQLQGNMQDSITLQEQRLQSAEQKITPDAIINTVQNTISSAKNEAINSANSSTDSKLQNYATTSSLTQTANNLIAKFESSGGSNLIKNGAFKNGTAHWNIWGNPSAFHINHSENGYGHELRIVTNDKDQGAMQTIDHLRTGTAYTIACDVWVESGNCIMYVVDGSHWYLSSISSGTGWNKLSITFTPTSSSVSVRIGRGTEGSNGDYRFTAIRMYMGNVVEAWTPHHSESYDGIIKLDSNGIEVSHTGANTTTHMNSKGFFIYNSQGETVGSLATETGLSVVNANKVYADNINTIYQGDANLYVNHNHTGSNLGTSDNPFRSFADLKRHLESQPVINKNVSIYVKTTSEITEQLTLTGLSGSGWIWIYYDKTCVHRQVTGGAYSIVLNNISNYIGIEGGRSNYNSSDGAVICDKWNAHGINITNCNNVYIGNINIHCQNWGIKVHRSRIRTWRVDFCGTWCCLDLSELSHGTDKDSCGGSAGGEFFRLYDGSIFLYGDTGGGYRPVGAKQEISGRYFLVGGERTATNSFRTPPPAPTTSDQYNTWSMNDYGYFTYGRNGINTNKWNPTTRRIQQGEWSGYGNNYGFAFFDHSGIRNWLANGTPKDGSTITLKRASSGGYSSAQPVYLYGATNTSCSGTPSGLKSYGNIGTLAWGETKTFNLPTAFVNDFKSGAIKSICFYDSSGASYVKLESVSIKLKANKPV